MLKLILYLVFGAFVLWIGVSNLWGGFTTGIFPGIVFSDRASPDEQPVKFWILITFYAVVSIIALVYVSWVLLALLRQRGAP